MIISWLITKLGKSVCRVIWDGSLASFGTSYKGLSQRGIHLSSGDHCLCLKEDKFHSNQPVSHWQQLVCPRSPFLLNEFQSSLILLESCYFQGESNAICYEGQGLLPYGKHQQLPKLHHLDHLGAICCISNPDLSFLDIPPHTWGILLPFLSVGSHPWCGFQAKTQVSLVVLQGFEVLV